MYGRKSSKVWCLSEIFERIDCWVLKQSASFIPRLFLTCVWQIILISVYCTPTKNPLWLDYGRPLLKLLFSLSCQWDSLWKDLLLVFELFHSLEKFAMLSSKSFASHWILTITIASALLKDSGQINKDSLNKIYSLVSVRLSIAWHAFASRICRLCIYRV